MESDHKTHYLFNLEYFTIQWIKRDSAVPFWTFSQETSVLFPPASSYSGKFHVFMPYTRSSCKLDCFRH